MIDNFEDVMEVLAVFDDADECAALSWRICDGGIEFYATCSDTFCWGSADAEEITAADVPLLRQTLVDLQAIDAVNYVAADSYLGTLYSARKRGMRPMRLYLYDAPNGFTKGIECREVVPLFEAAGPPRDPATEG